MVMNGQENSDPYKLCATLKNLDYEVMQKITAIILFDDVHTATAWRILENYTRTTPVEPSEPVEPAEPLSHVIKGWYAPGANPEPINLTPLNL